jgi:hypothetical protein
VAVVALWEARARTEGASPPAGGDDEGHPADDAAGERSPEVSPAPA